MANHRPPVEKCYKKIGLRIRWFRMEAGLSQRELAEKVRGKSRRKRGLTRAHIANMERGEQRIWPHQVEQIGRALGVPANWFFVGVWGQR